MDVVEKMKSALNQAIQFEKDGIDYYTEAEQKSQSPFIKKVFSDLVQDEREHIRAVKKIYEQVVESKQWEEQEIAPTTLSFKSIFAESKGVPEESLEDDLKALQHAADMEERGMKMYDDLSKKASNSAESKFYTFLHAEEIKHRKLLLDSLEYLKDPNAWEMKHGKASLDGA